MSTVSGKGVFAKSCRVIIKIALLVFSAFLFALPFVAQNSDGAGLLCLFGWVGLVVPFVRIFDFKKSLKRVFGSLFCFFFAFYFFSYIWFAQLYPLDFVGLTNTESVLVVILALTAIPTIHSFLMTLCLFLSYIGARKINSSILKSVILSCGYVLGEYTQTLGTFAFPWVRLCIGQVHYSVLVQSASLLGSYFVSFIIVLVNAFFAFSLVNLKHNKRKSAFFALCATFVFALNLFFGIFSVNADDVSSNRINALVLQGNIPSSEKWTGDADEIEIYSSLVKSAKEYLDENNLDTDLVAFPETAFPYEINPFDEYKTETERTLKNMAQTLSADVFAGAFYRDGDKVYNSIFKMDSDGEFSYPYNKHNTVPFGEYLPYRNILEKVLSSFANMNMFSEDISRGEGFETIKTRFGQVGCLVCFDSIFPDNARCQVKNGAQLIVISTNDSWYKTSSALYMHAKHAQMRAIENNVPVIRSANTGISEIIDSKGRIVGKTNVNERTFLVGTVSLSNTRTLYTRVGDIIIPIALVSVIFAIVYGAVLCCRKSE